MIPHCAWLYLRFCLGHRDVEEWMLARGVIVTYEAIRQWCRKFGQTYAKELRCRRPQPGDIWHLDEVSLALKGTRHRLWRALDPDGNDPNILAQHRCDKAAVKTFLRASLKGLSYVPRVIITAKLANYGCEAGDVAHWEYRQHRYRKNRAENSHQPTRQRSRPVRRFTSAG